MEYFDKHKGHAKLDKLFADITELLTILIDQISSYDTHAPQQHTHDIKAYFTNVLSSIEVILKDPFYREKLQSSTILLTQLVLMLDQIADEEAKLILIKIVGILGKNSECRMVIGMHDGFKKLLAVMLQQNEGLMKGIIETFKQLLDISPNDYAIQPAPPLASAQQTISLSKDVAAMSQEELKSILQSDNPGGKKEEAKTAIAPIAAVPAKPRAARKLNLEDTQNNDKGRPSYEILSRISKEMEDENTTGKYESLLNKDRSKTIGIKKDSGSDIGRKSTGDKISCASLFRNFDTDQQRKDPFEEVKTNPVIEQMVVQGTLTTVGEIILSAKHYLQVDLMMVICKLIAKNSKNQEEFEKIDGYFLLAVVLSERRDFEDEKEKKHLENCLRILKRIIFDDSAEENAIIANYEAFKVLLSLISNAPQYMTVFQAVTILSEILASNVRNCIIFLKLLGFIDLQILLFRLLFQEIDYPKILISEFCAKNNIKSMKPITRFKACKGDKEDKQKDEAENSLFYETIPISEKELIELFTEVDLLICSLSYILNPLPILPGARVYSSCIPFLAEGKKSDQILKCVLDRMESIEKDKIAK